ncbi:39S ribosomal protein L33, mitochondrial [Belonocnema kinseyi]|uniref:39S ribosomal protein L33, mitochondrial n=1 Tax=Belonocnema kinseyi TaxID=2817044 RepID=UPI00143DF7D2|nr:39S ribosomal protein L33, mitochondrial [Belonocnema kinseyi]
MFLTNILLAEAKKKSKYLMVTVQSMVSGHSIILVRPREQDKYELIKFDPWIRKMAYYKEIRKIRAL